MSAPSFAMAKRFPIGLDMIEENSCMDVLSLFFDFPQGRVFEFFTSLDTIGELYPYF